LGAHHRIETVERFVKNENCRLVCDRLREPDALSHTLAVSRYFAIRGISKVDTLDCKLAQLVCVFAIVTMNEQKRVDKLAASHAARKRIELGAVTKFTKELLRLIGGNPQNGDRAARWS